MGTEDHSVVLRDGSASQRRGPATTIIPITRDQGLEIEETEKHEKVVGELLWTVTRSRPDAMFAVAKMGSGTLRCPMKVCEVGEQVKGFLGETIGDGLMFLEVDAEGDDLQEVFTGRLIVLPKNELKGRQHTEFLQPCSLSHSRVMLAFQYSSHVLWQNHLIVSLEGRVEDLQDVVEGIRLIHLRQIKVLDLPPPGSVKGADA